MQIIIQTRDVMLVRAVGDFGFLSVKQIACLFFMTSEESARKRIQKLANAGLISVERVPPVQASLVCLTRRSRVAMRQLGMNVLPTSVNPVLLRHALAVRDVLIECHQRAVAHDLSLVQSGFSSRDVQRDLIGSGIIPDGFLYFPMSSALTRKVFLEIDCGTETHRRLALKVRAYQVHFRRLSLFRCGSTFTVAFLFASESRAAAFSKNLPQKHREWVHVGSLSNCGALIDDLLTTREPA